MPCKPDLQSGKFSKRFDDAVGTAPDTSRMYMVPTALRSRHDATRSWEDLPTVALAEEMITEIREDPDTLADFLKAKAAGDLPPIYYEHPAVASAPPGETVLPLSLCIDGVAYQGCDGVLGCSHV